MRIFGQEKREDSPRCPQGSFQPLAAQEFVGSVEKKVLSWLPGSSCRAQLSPKALQGPFPTPPQQPNKQTTAQCALCGVKGGELQCAVPGICHTLHSLPREMSKAGLDRDWSSLG